MTPVVEIEPEPHWWKASALTTRPTQPPNHSDHVTIKDFLDSLTHIPMTAEKANCIITVANDGA